MINHLREFGFTVRWLLQAGSGVFLVVLLSVHLIVNHWAAPHGLLSYTDVITYYKQPMVIVMEAIFLIVVTIHCLLGIHAIVLDLHVSDPVTRIFTQALILLGALVIVYGLELILSVHSLSVSWR